MPSRKICIAFVPIIISITEKAFWCVPLKLKNMSEKFFVSRVAQWKRAGPITQRSEDQNLALLGKPYFLLYILRKMIMTVTSTKKKFRIKNNIQIIDNNLRWLNTVLAVCECMSFAKSWQEKGCSSQAETWQVENILMKDFD